MPVGQPLPFGPFAHDGASWVSSIVLDGSAVRIDVSDRVDGSAPDVAAVAVLWLVDQLATVLVACADRLLTDYRTSWALPGSTPMSLHDFVTQLQVREIAVLGSGVRRIVLGTRLFRGQDVVVEASSDGAITDAFLEI